MTQGGTVREGSGHDGTGGPTAADGAYDDGDAAVDCEALNRMARRQAENHAGTMMFDTVDELMAYLGNIVEKEPEG